MVRKIKGRITMKRVQLRLETYQVHAVLEDLKKILKIVSQIKRKTYQCLKLLRSIIRRDRTKREIKRIKMTPVFQ